jgi:predicted lipoprotein with Yx(FWY)xxD motif
MRILAGLAAVAALTFAGAALAKPDNVEAQDGALVTTDGMPLYTFARDTQGAGTSACTEGCLARWPILEAAEDAMDDGDWTVITRDDGTKQWAYKGWPLYMYADDTAGEPATGVSDNWPLAME